MLIYFGWIIFAAKDFGALIQQFVAMFYASKCGIEPTLVVLGNSLPLLLLGVLLAVGGPWLRHKMSLRFRKQSYIPERVTATVLLIFALMIFTLCTVSLVGSAARPSMYAGF